MKKRNLSAGVSRAALIASFHSPYWQLISQDERDKAAKAGEAMPDSPPTLSVRVDA